MNKKNNVIVTGKEVESSKWWKKIHIKPIHIFMGVLVILVIMALYCYIAKPYANEFVCISGHSKIIIKFDKNNILSTKEKNISFEIENKDEEITIGNYLFEINKKFYDMSGEYCKINDLLFIASSEENSSNNLQEGLAEVGNSFYGYVDIPELWTRFYDPYSKYLTFTDGIYSISILYEEDYEGTVDDYFLEYQKSIEDDSNNSEIQLSSEIVGEEISYIASVISYYNQSKKKYYVTYIFADENNKVHYVELSGEKDLKKYLHIPKSFRKEPKRLY